MRQIRVGTDFRIAGHWYVVHVYRGGGLACVSAVSDFRWQVFTESRIEAGLYGLDLVGLTARLREYHRLQNGLDALNDSGFIVLRWREIRRALADLTKSDATAQMSLFGEGGAA